MASISYNKVKVAQKKKTKIGKKKENVACRKKKPHRIIPLQILLKRRFGRKEEACPMLSKNQILDEFIQNLHKKG